MDLKAKINLCAKQHWNESLPTHKIYDTTSYRLCLNFNMDHQNI